MSAQPQMPAGLPVKSPDCFFIGGKWEKPAGKGTLDVISPVTEQVVMTFPEASPADVDKAVAAARKAFDTGRGRACRRRSAARCCSRWRSS